MNICTILYGMSGALKEATLKSYIYSDDYKVYSDTKIIFDLDEKYFNWSSRVNDCHLAMHRLLTLKHLPNDRSIVIERGITDNLFCVPNRCIQGLESYDNMDIESLVNLETKFIEEGRNIAIIRKLLIMKDEDFISNVVLDENKQGRHRKAIYPDLETYMSKQNEYIDFTKKWNKIDEIVVINNARNYIENTLGKKYEE